MASTPFRRRGKLAKAARNLAIADAALALAKDRMGSGSSSKKGSRGKALLIGGAAVAVAAGAFWKRDKVAGLLPSKSETHEYEPHSPGPSNYDAPGPVANTATPVPAPDPQEPEAIDEAAEEAAAAAEAANIGGTVSDYAGPSGQHATEAERPLAEAGEGESEGQEQAELALEEAAEPTAPGISDAERQIDETIEAAGDPNSGERIEPVRPSEEPAAADETPPAEDAAPAADAAPEDATPDTSAEDAAPDDSSSRDEPAPFEEPKQDKPDETGESDWRTWSGRSINP